MAAQLPIAAACLSGVAFAIMGVAYRLGQTRRFAPPHLLALCALTGVLFFGLRSSAAPPPFVVILGVCSGLGQYAALRLIQPALRLGPLSPMWCALSLGFVPSALYAVIAYRTPTSAAQFAGVALAILAVVLGALQQRSESTVSAKRRRGLYGLVLLSLFVTNSLISVAIADLKAHPGYGGNLFDLHGNAFMTAMFAAEGACVWIDFGAAWLRSFRRGQPMYRWPPFLAISLLMVLGSNAGLQFLRLSGSLSPAVTFTLSGMISLLAAAVISVTLFGEKPSALWLLMMAAAAGAIPLVNLT